MFIVRALGYKFIRKEETTLKKRLLNGFFRMRNQVKNFLKDDAGETNIIAIILIIIVVIALVALFRTQLTEIVNGLFQQIKDALGL